MIRVTPPPAVTALSLIQNPKQPDHEDQEAAARGVICVYDYEQQRDSHPASHVRYLDQQKRSSRTAVLR